MWTLIITAFRSNLSRRQTFDERTGLRISCRELGWQLSSLSQVFASLFPSIHMVQHLYIYGFRDFPLQCQDDIENMQWLEFLHPFTEVKNIYLSKNLHTLGYVDGHGASDRSEMLFRCMHLSSALIHAFLVYDHCSSFPGPACTTLSLGLPYATTIYISAATHTTPRYPSILLHTK
jgi:hypothetical protein